MAVDRSLSVMGTHARIVVGEPARDGLTTPGAAADAVERLLVAYDRCLSRFRPDSELSSLNADPRTIVPASGLLRAWAHAALAAADLTGGLVDPCLLGELERAGYRDSWDRSRRADLSGALKATAAPRRPAAPAASGGWRAISIDDAAGTITRPLGLRLDSGGTGKGHAADLAASLLEGYTHWAVDCGGDLRVGGDAGDVQDVLIEDPFSGEMGEAVRLRSGAVATSGLRSRIWEQVGGVAHHLLDPSTGRPAFTGLVACTALAPTAVEAEARAKAALLSGPGGAARFLAAHGGIVFAEDGEVQRIGRLQPPPRVRLALTQRR